jgi:hypothetical protein
MKVEQRISERFRELAALGEKVPSDHQQYLREREWHAWSASAIQLVTSVFGSDSPHARVLQKCADYDVPQSRVLDQALGAFSAAQSDYEAGLASNFRTEIAGEILGDFVALSKSALSEGHMTVAAVLASAALEDALK